MRIAAILAFLAGAALVAVLSIYAGIAPIAGALAHFGFAGLAIVVIAHLPVIALLGIAWWSIGRGAGEPGAPAFIWARAVRDAAAEALPFSQLGGYVVGARALILAGAGATRAGLSTLLDLTFEFLAKIPYVVLGLAILAWMKPRDAAFAAPAAAALGIAGLSIVLWLRKSESPAETLARVFARWRCFADMHARIAAILREMTANPRAVRGGALLHFACWILGAGETWLFLHFLHAPVGFWAALVVDSVTGGIRAAAFFVPGAIGVQEGSYVLLCGLFGIPPGTALALSLARRGRDLMIAGPVLLSWQWREGRALFQSRFKS